MPALKLWVDSILDRYAREVGNLEAPIDPTVLAKVQNSRILYREGTDHWFASLMPTRRGFIVYVRSDLWETRRRMAICHELGHTYFFDTTNSPPRRRDNARPDSKEENLCFWVAREFLVPSCLLESKINSKGHQFIYSAKNLHFLAQTFVVSLDTIVKRISHDLGLLGNDWITLWRSDIDPKQMFLFDQGLEGTRQKVKPIGFYPRHVSQSLSSDRRNAINGAVECNALKAITEDSIVISESYIGKRRPAKLFSRTEPVRGHPSVRAISWISLESALT